MTSHTSSLSGTIKGDLPGTSAGCRHCSTPTILAYTSFGPEVVPVASPGLIQNCIRWLVLRHNIMYITSLVNWSSTVLLEE
eukprot:scaffold669952_cov57-Prasinocladus_malaysianus.AAC.1